MNWKISGSGRVLYDSGTDNENHKKLQLGQNSELDEALSTVHTPDTV